MTLAKGEKNMFGRIEIYRNWFVTQYITYLNIWGTLSVTLSSMSTHGKTYKSAVAEHVWKEKHAMDHKPVLLKQTSNKQELTNWENTKIAL